VERGGAVTSIPRGRWWVKKLARRALAFAGGGLAAPSGPHVRALTYHRFGVLARDPFCLPPGEFAAQVRWLAESGRAISLDDLRALLAGERELRRDAVLVTIDDGFASTYRHALPVLRDYRVPAVAFVTAALVGDADAGRDWPERYMTWDELAELHAAGIEVGAHGYTHESLGRMPLEAAEQQGVRARGALEARLGRPVRAFAYPFGTRADFSRGTADALARAGFTFAFTSQHGAISSASIPLELPRVKVESGDGPRHFARLCDGAMDAWRVVDRGLAGLQKPVAHGASAAQRTAAQPTPAGER
jgi:peptidoglycan/xylan/chitin deacetylase (PgdA/CDA1 family)